MEECEKQSWGDYVRSLTEPNPVHDPRSKTSREQHEKIVAVDVASGAVSTFDLTVESAREEDPPAAP